MGMNRRVYVTNSDGYFPMFQATVPAEVEPLNRRIFTEKCHMFSQVWPLFCLGEKHFKVFKQLTSRTRDESVKSIDCASAGAPDVL